MIVKNRPLLKIERVFVDFRKNIQNGKKKKKRSDERYTVSGRNIRDKTQRRRKQILSSKFHPWKCCVRDQLIEINFTQSEPYRVKTGKKRNDISRNPTISGQSYIFAKRESTMKTRNLGFQ